MWFDEANERFNHLLSVGKMYVFLYVEKVAIAVLNLYNEARKKLAHE